MSEREFFEYLNGFLFVLVLVFAGVFGGYLYSKEDK
jgi:hypothetical protein